MKYTKQILANLFLLIVIIFLGFLIGRYLNEFVENVFFIGAGVMYLSITVASISKYLES